MASFTAFFRELLGINEVRPDNNLLEKHNLISLEFNNLSSDNKNKVFNKLTENNKKYPTFNSLNEQFKKLELNYKYDLIDLNISSVGEYDDNINDILDNNNDYVSPNNLRIGGNNVRYYMELEKMLLVNNIYISNNSLIFYIDANTKTLVKLNIVDRRNRKHIFFDNINNNLFREGINSLINTKILYELENNVLRTSTKRIYKIFGVFQKPIDFKTGEDYYIVPAFVDYRDIENPFERDKYKKNNIDYYNSRLSINLSNQIQLPLTSLKLNIIQNKNYILPFIPDNKSSLNIKYHFFKYNNIPFNISPPIINEYFNPSTVLEGSIIEYPDKPDLETVLVRKIFKNNNKIVKIKASVSRTLINTPIKINNEEYFINQDNYNITIIDKPIIKYIYPKSHIFNDIYKKNIYCILKRQNPNTWYIY